MTHRFSQMRTALLASTLVAGLPQIGAAQSDGEGTPPAQSSASQSDDAIIVTAQRRDATLQNTGAALSALSGEDLAEQGITSLESLGVAIPGVQISQYQGDSSVFVRGIGTPIIVGGGESSTATYVDGVYISRPSAAGASFFDLESVQVLRGPQGTLYGRNATGGSVLLTSNAPS